MKKSDINSELLNSDSQEMETVQDHANKSGRKSQNVEENTPLNDHEEKENTEQPQKMNAFQFMMSSRNKSIGRNSPGREVDLNESVDSAITKQTLKTRKSRLENWAQEKGSAKRKREYEETGKCITVKLEKRGRKLKKMLSIDCQSDDEVITKRKRRCAAIESDDDSQKEMMNGVKEDEEKKKFKKKKKSRLSLNKVEKNRNVEDSVKLTPKSVKAWKFKIKLCMDENKEEIENEEIDKEKPKSDEEKHEKMDLDDTQGEDTVNEDLVQNGESLEAIETKNEDFEVIEEKSVLVNLDESQENEEYKNGILPQNDESVDPQREESESDVVLIEKPENDNGRRLRTRRQQPKFFDEFLSGSDDDDEDFSPKSQKKMKKEMKLAPVFLKAVPKAKLDPKVVEARRQFLLSGVPSSLKKEMERQQCIEEIEFDVFPTLSHVQQKSEDSFWNLPKVELKVNHSDIENIEVEPFSKNLLCLDCYESSTKDKILPNKLKHCKKIIKEIKSQNPNYPVYKIFNSIYSKSRIVTKPIEKPAENNEKPTTRRRGRPKKNSVDKSKEPVLPPTENVKTEENTHALWTEKYKPNSSADIIGNQSSVSSLKAWLKNWLLTSKIYKKKRGNDSESEFITDSDSCDSLKMVGNTVILKGPTGSGKTAAVYAVCHELGWDVLEVNASSKRTGKRLLQELQEATQSHQVCKTGTLLSSLVKEKKEKPIAKMCVLVIEDVDIVFEQDEGFTNALSQIITTSKRPVILTTTDEPSLSVQRVINNHPTIYFLRLSSALTIWLQILCLVEGFYVDVKSLDELLNYNKGDIRRTLLQLQLYVSSGGQPNKIENKNQSELVIENDIRMDDDNSNLSDLKLDESTEITEEVQIHRNCVDICNSVKNYKSFSLPHCNNFEIIWWNMASILSLPNFSKIRLDRVEKTEICENDKKEKEKIKMISECYDSLSYAEIMCGRNNAFYDSVESRWRTKTKDSLALEENMCCYNGRFCDELAQTLLSGTIAMYRKQVDVEESRLNLAVPESLERRWRSKQLSSEEKLQQALLESDCLERKSLVLDYMPCLRNIVRVECEQAANSTKRGNRYDSYLKTLGVRCSDSTLKSACDVFKIWN